MTPALAARLAASLCSADPSVARAYGCGVYRSETLARGVVARERGTVLVMGTVGKWLTVPRAVAAELVRGGAERAR